MTTELVTLLHGRRIGVVQRRRNGRLTFVYDDDWRTAREATTLSLSMPLAVREHEHAAIDAFLWNLLPDNAQILEAWARRFAVSPRNAFALVSHVGEDCAGAVQFVPPDRVAVLDLNEMPHIEWLDEAAVAERLRALRRDSAAWRSPGDTGQFSLAGSQSKTALLRQDGRWGVPSGRAPTTHILKLPDARFQGHAENEHLCLTLARTVGLPTAASRVERFEDEVAIVIERYDRASTAALAAQAAAEAAAAAADGQAALAANRAARAAQMGELAATHPVLRLHQEDLCQAFGRRPSSKYQYEGGPTPADIVGLLRQHSGRPREDVATFVEALAFNWLVGGSDAHAKNYSLLHGSRGRVRLAPLYDIASTLPYPAMPNQKVKLAMKIGGAYRLREIGAAEWEKLARELQLEPREVLDSVEKIGAGVALHLGTICEEARDQGLTNPLVPMLESALKERAEACVSGVQRYGRSQQERPNRTPR